MLKVLARPAVAAGAAALLAASVSAPAQAATGSWSDSRLHYTIYSDGGYSETYLSRPSSTPFGGSISEVTFTARPYSNGNYLDEAKICYQQPYSTSPFKCRDFNITGTAVSETTDFFNGLDPRGNFFISHKLHGGTYPTYGETNHDSITVKYAY